MPLLAEAMHGARARPSGHPRPALSSCHAPGNSRGIMVCNRVNVGAPYTHVRGRHATRKGRKWLITGFNTPVIKIAQSPLFHLPV